MNARIERIAVIVPAHNEEQLLPGCLASVLEAARWAGVPVSVIVALDACTDATAAIVQAIGTSSVRGVRCSARNVGAARATGMRAALASGSAGLWLATTDADSVVPPTWLCAQLRHAREGAHAVVGTVWVGDWSAHPAGTERSYLRGYRFGAGHGHTHGANLGVSASAYTQVGGFPPLPNDEDVALVRRLIAAGVPLVWAADLPVRTSGRALGRAPAGFAAHLRAAAERTEEARVG